MLKPTRTFITTRKDHYVSRFITTDNVKGLEKALSQTDTVAIDTEFSDLHPLYANLLLIGIFDGTNTWLIDATSIDISFLNKFSEKLYIGHNIKIDYEVLKVNGFEFHHMYDTMIVEQRLGGGHTRSNSLEATVERRLKRYLPPQDTSKEFIGKPLSMSFSDKHLEYLAGDIEHLINIKKAQQPLIDFWKMNFLIYDIELPLIKILANAELEGFKVDEDKMRKIIQNNKTKLLEVEKELDNIRKNLPNIPVEYRTGKWGRERNREELVQLDLFGNHLKVQNKNEGCVNYSSSQQILDFIKGIGLPTPWITDDKDRSAKKPSIKEEALQRYLLEFPDTILKDFIHKLLEYKEIEKELTSFGEKFINYHIIKGSGLKERGYKHPKTDRVHTVFKQCMTSTSRLSSGDSKRGFYNCQQIPKREENGDPIFRASFIADNDNYITTADLSGAELIIMCALAKDFKLYELGSNDLHSPLAQKSWREVFLYRAGKKINAWKTPEEYQKLKTNKDILLLIEREEPELYEKHLNFTVNKNKKVILPSSKVDVRTDFKSMGFGVIYGMFDKKGGETLNIPKDEAAVVIESIKEELRPTIKMVEEASDHAMKYGYVIHNTRTNSLRRFPKTEKKEMSFIEEVETRSEARNTRIQGTQADMIKESMVEIQKYINLHNEPAWLRLSVHDELVYEHSNYEFGKTIKKIMEETANKYLIPGIEMKATYSTLRTWTK